MNSEKIKRMVGIGVLIALVAVMQFVGTLIPPISGFPITLVLIPVVLGSAVYGPSAGAILGGAFGLLVFINCSNGTDPGGAMVFQANPALCFAVVMAKGILAGLSSGWVYVLLRDKNPYLAMLCSAFICPLVNTGVFIACMLLFFVDVLSAWAQGGDLLGYILSALVLVNFVPELIVNLLFSPVSARIRQTILKK